MTNDVNRKPINGISTEWPSLGVRSVDYGFGWEVFGDGGTYCLDHVLDTCDDKMAAKDALIATLQRDLKTNMDIGERHENLLIQKIKEKDEEIERLKSIVPLANHKRAILKMKLK